MSSSQRSLEVKLDLLIGDYKQKAGQAAEATNKIGDAGESASARLGKAASGAAKTVGAVTVAAAAGSAALLVNALKTGTAYNQLEQTSRAAFKTVLGSSEAAAEMMEKVAAFAKTSPFPRQAFIKGTQQLLAFGMSAEKIVPTLSAVQDAVAAAGGGGQQITEVVDVLAKVTSTGKITATTLNELGNRGIDAAKLIGQGMGKSGNEIRSQITKGTLDAGKAVDVLVAQMAKSFDGAAAGVKDTWVGSTDRIKGAWRDISSIIAEPFVQKAGGGLALDWANSLADALRAVEGKAGPVVDVVINRLTPAFDKILPAINRAKDGINNWDIRNLNGQLDSLAQNGPALGAVTAAVVAMGTQLPILQKLGLAVNPLTAGLVALVALSPELRGAFGSFLADLAPLLPVAQQAGTELLNVATTVLTSLSPALGDLLTAIAPVIVQLGTGLGGAAVQTAQALVPVAQIVANVVTAVAGLPTPVLAGAAAFAAVIALRGPLSSMLGGLATQFQILQQRMAIQSALSPATTQLGTFSAAAAVARTSVSRLALTMKTAFLSNPIGIAIGAISLAVGGLVNAHSMAQEAATAHKNSVDGLTGALIASSGAIDDNVRAKIAQQLQEKIGRETGQDLLSQIEKAGLAQNVYTEAITGGQSAREELYNQLIKVAGAAREGNDPENYKYDEQGAAALDLATGLREMGSAYDESKAKQQAYARETGGANNAISEQNRLIQENMDKQREAAGATLSQSQADLRYAETLAKTSKEITLQKGSWDAKTQSLKLNNDEQRKNSQLLIDEASQGRTRIEAMEKNNASAKDLRKTMGELRENFIKNATAATGNKKAAEALADAYGLIPDQVATNIDVKTENAEARIDSIVKKLLSAPDGQVTIKENAPEVIAALEGLGLKVETLPDGKIKVTEEGATESGKKISDVASADYPAVIKAAAETGMAEAALNEAARDRTSRVTQTVNTNYTSTGTRDAEGANYGNTRRASGGSVFGPGTETSDSIPALLSNNEHVWSAKEVKGAGGHGVMESMRQLARNGGLIRRAKGGPVAASEKKVKSLKRSYESIPGGKANRTRKLSAKWAYEDAKKELASIKAGGKKAEAARKKAEAARKKAEKEEREKQARLSDGRFDLRTEARRGTVTDAFTSGGGMSYVDKMFDASNNKDLSKKQRSAMRSLGYSTEKQLLRLEKDAARVEKALDKAVAARDKLLDARNAVQGSMVGSFDLGSQVGLTDAFGDPKKFTKASALSYAKAKATSARTLRDKVKKLQSMGFGPDMIQTAIDEWVSSGTFEIADVLASMSKAEVRTMNSSYSAVSTYGRQTGDALTLALAKGGLNAAQTLVNTLKKEEKSVEKAFYNLGKAGQKGFHKAWGIASPAKEAQKDIGWIAKGHLGEIEKHKPAFASAMEGLYSAPQYSVPHFNAQPAPAPAVTPIINLTAIVTNPFTGEQVEAVVRNVAVSAVPSAIQNDHRNNSRGGVYAGRY